MATRFFANGFSRPMVQPNRPMVQPKRPMPQPGSTPWEDQATFGNPQGGQVGIMSMPGSTPWEDQATFGNPQGGQVGIMSMPDMSISSRNLPGMGGTIHIPGGGRGGGSNFTVGPGNSTTPTDRPVGPPPPELPPLAPPGTPPPGTPPQQPGFNFGTHLMNRGGFEGLLPENLPADAPPESILGLALATLSGRDRFLNPQRFQEAFGDLNDPSHTQGRIGGVGVGGRQASPLERLLGGRVQGALQSPASPDQIGGVGTRPNIHNVGTRAEVNSDFKDPLRNELLNPDLNGTSDAEGSVINQIVSQANARATQRGLGPASAASVSQAIAPQLMQFRQNRLNNLQGALNADRTAGLTSRGQDVQTALGNQSNILGQRGQDVRTMLGNQTNLIGQRGQDISANANRLQQLLSGLQGQQQTSLTERGQGLDAQLRNQGNLIGQRGQELDFRSRDVAGVRDLFRDVSGQETQRRQDTLNTLLQLTGLSMPQNVVANSSTSSSRTDPNWLGPLLEAGIGRIPIPGGCWIAASIYGDGSFGHIMARYWIVFKWQGKIADMVRAVYMRFGRWAAKRKWLCKALKPLFDKAVRLGWKSFVEDVNNAY